MKKISIGILAHVDAGKTTLSEALLYEAGALKSLGRVDNKDAFLDTFDLEKERGITIFSKLARLSVNDTEFILVDTPGHVDFSQEMERTLNVLDEAVLLINASDGVQGHTKTVWRLLKARDIPTFIFVNKMDLPGTDRETVLRNIRKELSAEAVDFSDTGSSDFYEEVATGSEKLLNEYMDEGKISEDSISSAIRKREVFPVFFGSALKYRSVREFLEALSKYSLPGVHTEGFGAIAYKISKDSQGNRLTYVRITGGTLKNREILNDEKITDIRQYSGDRYESVREAEAGDIVALLGLKESKAGMVYGEAKKGKANVLEPVVTYAITYPDDVDTVTMHGILKELEEEEPGLKVEFRESTKELYVHLMGEIQTEILKSLISTRYGIGVNFGTGRVLYRETINDVVEGVGHFEPLRHYAEVHLRLEPMEQGSGLTFDTEVSEDELAINWQRLVLTHLKEKEHRGVLTGSPITDMKITLVAGRANIKHTEGGDFRQATYRAVRQGLMQAESVLLEPFYYYELTIPENSVGRAMTDIDKMWGNSQVVEQKDGMSVLTGTAPVSTMNGYLKDVLEYTRGLGTLSLSLAGFEPCHNTEEVLAAFHYDPTADLRNTPDSVFCSHGAGTVVPWNEVPEYMHIPFRLYADEGEVKEELFTKRPEKAEVFVTTEEIDEIINRTSFANKNGRKFSYKGVSAAQREHRRESVKIPEKPMQYKGTQHKEKFMLIDGYNVVHAWPELRDIAERDINAAAGRLMDIVSNYQGMSGLQTILVFDAYRVPGHSTEVIAYNNIQVVYTKTAETADHYIERYTHENGRKYDITVVTSDGVEQVIIRGAGSQLLSSRDFYETVKAAEERLRENNNLWSSE